MDSQSKEKRGQIFLGTEEFVRELGGLLKTKEKVEEVPRVQRYAARPSLDELFGEAAPLRKRTKDGLI